MLGFPAVRRFWFLVLLLTSCTKERQLVSIEGVSVTVPGDFIPMDEERVEKLRRAAEAAAPGTEVAMVGRRPKGTPLPWMYVQRTALRPVIQGRLQVSKVLELAKREVLSALTEGGFETVSASSREVGDSLDTCVVTKAKVDAKALNHTCVRMWVGKQTLTVHTISVVCLSLLDDDAECKRILETRTITPSAAMKLDDFVQ